jgi:hypothetical protein
MGAHRALLAIRCPALLAKKAVGAGVAGGGEAEEVTEAVDLRELHHLSLVHLLWWLYTHTLSLPRTHAVCASGGGGVAAAPAMHAGGGGCVEEVGEGGGGAAGGGGMLLTVGRLNLLSRFQVAHVHQGRESGAESGAEQELAAAEEQASATCRVLH